MIWYVIVVIAGTPFLSVETYLTEKACIAQAVSYPASVFPDCIPQRAPEAPAKHAVQP